MANETIKKFKTPIEDMPPISSTTEGYSLRYRVISSDKNRTSHWSPVYLISPDYSYVPGIIHFNKAGDIASIVWDAVTVNKVDDTNTYFIKKESQYDFWVRWDRGESKIATITNISASSGTITYTATNTFSIGNIVTIAGVVPNQYNLTNATIATASGSNFTIANPATGTFVSGGEAETQGGDWLYKERLSTTSLSLPVPTTYTVNGVVQPSPPNRMSVEVYLPGNPIERANGAAGTPFLKVYRLRNQTV
jgi:hypothetical protein